MSNGKSRHGRCQLTDKEALELRAAHATKCPHCGRKPTYKELGDRYGISSVAAFKIIKRESYRHLP